LDAEQIGTEAHSEQLSGSPCSHKTERGLALIGG